jgi:RNA polymerase sigma factor (sigma-70 family)
MAHGPGLYETLRDLAGGRDLRSDAELIEHFLATRDEQAFGVLLGRHGPLVWGVCRRVLGRVHDAEDAFQATFLILARKAASIRRRTSVRCWLHGVALRVALRTREQGQRTSEALTAEPSAAGNGPSAAADLAELSAVLDEEVRKLPERYRWPLVLCYLAGRTNAEAASELGCPGGTLAVRLARARERLRRGLVRRGLGPTAVLPALPAGVELPETLVPPTRVAVATYSTGWPGVGAAAKLANGVMTSMLFDKCKVAVFVVFSAVVIAGSGLVGRALFAQTPTPPGAEPAQDKKPEPPPGGVAAASKLTELLKERQQSARVGFNELAGRLGVENSVYIASARRLLQADLDLSHSKDDKIAAWQGQADRLKKLLDTNLARRQAGRALVYDVEECRYYYLEALIELERLRSP